MKTIISDRKALANELSTFRPGLQVNETRNYYSLDIAPKGLKNAIHIPYKSDFVSFYIQDMNLLSEASAKFEMKPAPGKKDKYRLFGISLLSERELLARLVNHSADVLEREKEAAK